MPCLERKWNLTAVLGLVLVSANAPAQWNVVEETVPESDEPLTLAMVANDSGHSLRIYVDSDNRVRGIFQIRDGFDTIAESSCPTYRIDHWQPAVLTSGEDWCRLEPKRAYFTLGILDGETIRSTPLIHLMNGTFIMFRYHLASLGYRETRFTLSGSKQALYDALGGNVTVVVE